MASAQHEPEDAASLIFSQFLDSLTQADAASVVALFADDALFWGTGMQSLVEDLAGVESYFSAAGSQSPGQNVARALEYSTRVVSSTHVLLSGRWEVVRDGQAEGSVLRLSMAISLTEGEWKIVQFHNSLRP